MQSSSTAPSSPMQVTWGSQSDQKGLLKGKTLKRLGKGLLLQLTDCSGKQYKANI